MKKKKMKRRVCELEIKIRELEEVIARHQCYCENYKPKTVTWRAWTQLSKKEGRAD